MSASTRDEEVWVSLFTRTTLPGPSRRRANTVTATLQSLVGDGPFATVEQRTWPKRVPVDDCDSDVRDVYLDWTDWARRAGVSLRPFFATRECYDPDAEDYTDWLVTPAIALAVHVDEDLVAVYPHEDGGETVTVEDGIDALEARTSSSPDPSVRLAN